VKQIRAIQTSARRDGHTDRPLWPMIVLRTPKGWTGPKEVDGKRTEGFWRSHKVPMEEHPHGLSNREFDVLFTTDKPIIFAFHGYPWLIHRLTYRRTNHSNLHVRGYKEEGTTTTPFDMVVRNDMDRFHLVEDVIDRVPLLRAKAAYAKQAIRDKLIEHRQYIYRHGQDRPEIQQWRWGADQETGSARRDTAADF
jgi:xylulose-5-phosphate/fructose-6-phosphate phosphoketolase